MELPMSMFGKWSGSEIRVGDTDYPIMRKGDLLGVLEEMR
jgi:co-chaperonin GroES (HSP10)